MTEKRKQLEIEKELTSELIGKYKVKEAITTMIKHYIYIPVGDTSHVDLSLCMHSLVHNCSILG